MPWSIAAKRMGIDPRAWLPAHIVLCLRPRQVYFVGAHAQEFSDRRPGLIQWVSVSPMFRRRQPADADAFGAEVLTYLEPLYATALEADPEPGRCRILVQDTLVKALRFSDKFESGTNLRAWLSTILHNTWRNRVRDAGREAVEVDSTRSKRPKRQMVDPEARRPSNSCSGTRSTATFAPHSTSCRMSFARRSGCASRRVLICGDREDARCADGTVMSRISRGRRQLLDQLRKTRATA